jgi:hypothetical protein
VDGNEVTPLYCFQKVRILDFRNLLGSMETGRKKSLVSRTISSRSTLVRLENWRFRQSTGLYDSL